MTTRKQMKKFAISLINEIVSSKQAKIVKVDYSGNISVWFHYEDDTCERIPIYNHLALKENISVVKQAKNKIRGLR
ncbi:MAG: hypothetical protein PF437_03395 [Sulfurimonas sp.]|jgi:hypothetical protein|nr:hypothetical protein [Sulfurimonas sp.]